MKIVHATLIPCITLLLISCQTNLKHHYCWTYEKQPSKYGQTTVARLYEDKKVIYAFIDNPVVGVSHCFMNGSKNLFTISDGTGNDIIGSGVTISPRLNKELYILDLDMDGDMDFVIYGSRYFGRFKDNKFAPFTNAMIGEEKVLSYLSKRRSEQVVDD